MRKKFYQRRIASFFLAFPISMAVFVLVHSLYLWIAEGKFEFFALPFVGALLLIPFSFYLYMRLGPVAEISKSEGCLYRNAFSKAIIWKSDLSDYSSIRLSSRMLRAVPVSNTGVDFHNQVKNHRLFLFKPGAPERSVLLGNAGSKAEALERRGDALSELWGIPFHIS